jgi:hypothetical protein
VKSGDVLLELHHRQEYGLEEARRLCGAAVTIDDTPPAARDHVLDEVRVSAPPNSAPR